MKKMIFVFLMLASISSAQENWGPGEYICGGSIFLEANPCFLPDTNAILLTDGWPSRINIWYFDNYWEEQFLPESLSVAEYDDCSPFMSSDGNSLYFSSDRPGGHGGYDIWMTEKIADAWIQPVNLGPEINSDRWEISPSLTADGSEIFFVRVDTTHYDMNGYIFRSEYSANHWTSAEPLPAPINIGTAEGSPSISGNGDRLYFNSHRANGLEGNLAAWVSYRQNETWQEPQLLTNDINNYWWQCGLLLAGWPHSVMVSFDGSRLLYNKITIWEIGWDCFDPMTNLYIAHRVVSTDNDAINLPHQISLSAYPNPFNSSMKISVEFPDANGDLTIYDILGRPLKSYNITSTTAMLEWHGDDESGQPCASGIYFIKARTDELQKTIKVGFIQ